ncbi:MAG: anti-sigma regulatory factor [Verrucomicrobiota bacterium]
MPFCLTNVRISYEHDVVLARQRARQVAGLLHFDVQDQVRIATAVSEIARNAFLYAKGGRVEFWVVETVPRKLEVRVNDEGPGIQNIQQVLDGRYSSPTGMGLGILGARRLMDEFTIECIPGLGTRVTMAKLLPARLGPLEPLGGGSVHLGISPPNPAGPLGELQRQNRCSAPCRSWKNGKANSAN